MNSEVLAIKLLDLTEGRETPESWRSWWDEHEVDIKADRGLAVLGQDRKSVV